MKQNAILCTFLLESVESQILSLTKLRWIAKFTITHEDSLNLQLFLSNLQRDGFRNCPLSTSKNRFSLTIDFNFIQFYLPFSYFLSYFVEDSIFNSNIHVCWNQTKGVDFNEKCKFMVHNNKKMNEMRTEWLDFKSILIKSLACWTSSLVSIKTQLMIEFQMIN